MTILRLWIDIEWSINSSVLFTLISFILYWTCLPKLPSCNNGSETNRNVFFVKRTNQFENKSRGELRKRCKCISVKKHLDLSRSHLSKYRILISKTVIQQSIGFLCFVQKLMLHNVELWLKRQDKLWWGCRHFFIVLFYVVFLLLLFFLQF